MLPSCDLDLALLVAQQVQQVRRLEAEESVPFVGAALRQLRAEVGGQAAVLGFVGAPFTLASYIVEGGSSKNFANLKRMAFSAPETLHALNSRLAESMADYVRYQVRRPHFGSMQHCRVPLGALVYSLHRATL
jgi:uroporphyrinogen-III decarboxylase